MCVCVCNSCEIRLKIAASTTSWVFSATIFLRVRMSCLVLGWMESLAAASGATCDRCSFWSLMGKKERVGVCATGRHTSGRESNGFELGLQMFYVDVILRA